MVLQPTDYSEGYLDADYLEWKSCNKKTKQKTLEDVEFAQKVAKSLIQELGLPQNVQHCLSKTPEEADFIFEGAGFHDPGDIVEWKNDVPRLDIPTFVC
jgi:hypothetical protein